MVEKQVMTCVSSRVKEILVVAKLEKWIDTQIEGIQRFPESSRQARLIALSQVRDKIRELTQQ